MKNSHYIDQGPKGGVPIVLIHAFPLNHTMWKPQISELIAEHRVIAYDIGGHGGSNVGDGQYTVEFFVDDLIALLDCLEIEKAVLCGLSLGGYIALRTVERHPERVSALILSDTRSDADTNDAKVKRTATLQLIKEKGVPFFADEFVKSTFAPETFDVNPEVVQTVKEMILKNPPLGICGAILALGLRTDTTASLQNINVPTLILVGEKDQVTPPAASLAMSEKIPNAQIHIIPHAGHFSNMENPSEFNQRVLSFLSKCSASPQ